MAKITRTDHPPQPGPGTARTSPPSDAGGNEAAMLARIEKHAAEAAKAARQSERHLAGIRFLMLVMPLALIVVLAVMMASQ
ncbi:MAG: hypothetical protein JJU36_17190 [Phycisphaeraceae bacterium]|nr:hypothetical protein [Phycisphaeraceae bacterium]